MERHLIHRILGSAFALAGAFTLLPAGPVLAAPGDFDPTFGDGGVVQTDFGSQTRDGGGDVIVRSDGSIVVSAGTEPNTFAAIGYTDTGDLDPNFGTGGIVKMTLPMGGGGGNIVEQPDGKIVMAGFVYVPQGEGVVIALAAARFSPTGQVDTSFGNNGLAIARFGVSAAGVDVALTPSGRIVVAGDVSPELAPTAFAVARFTPDGRLDRRFSGDGRRVIVVGEAYSYASAIAIQTDRRIVLAGAGIQSNQADFAFVRLLPNGAFDTSFDGDGKLLLDLADNDIAYDTLVDPDGRIMAVGIANSEGGEDAGDFAVARVLSDGTPDSTFGVDGRVITDVTGDDRFDEARLQPDGSLVAGGSALGDFQPDMALVRYSETGALDPTFGLGGVVQTDVSRYAGGVAIQTDGNIVASGSITVSLSDRDVIVARFLG